MKKRIVLLIVLALAVMALSGCFRKSIESAPPAKRPAAQEQTVPAVEPEIISETHTVDGDESPVIEETYDAATSGPTIIDESHDVPAVDSNAPVEVEAVVEQGDKPDIGGDDLAEEVLPEPAAEEAADQTEAGITDAKAKEAFEPAADPSVDPENEQVMDDAEMAEKAPEATTTDTPLAAETGQYYVQVGAFSDLENANKVLSGLLSDGYKGSMLVKTDTGMYRVRAGAFANAETAGKALDVLKTDYPNGFVLEGE